MRDQQQPGSDPLKEMRGNISMAVGLSQAFSMPAFAWWTKFGTAGELAFGNRLGVIGWLIMPLWPMCFMPCDVRPMYAFWGLTTLMLLCHRFRGWMLRRRGYKPHSAFVGYSRVSWPGRFTTLGAKEAALTSGIGLILAGAWPSLGIYVLVSGLAMAITIGYAGEVQRSMLRRMNDAKREQEWLMERMRQEEE